MSDKAKIYIIVHLQVYSGRFEHVGKFLNFKN